ncbi:MAG: hypothetical protein RLZZ336_622 [Cyanobacteriota bacterium]
MELLEGEGWRLRVDPGRQPFPVLIGGRDWGAELTAAEALLLQEGASTLVQQLAAIASSLMPEETIELELDRGGLWLQLAGAPDAWRLRFVLTPQQQGPGRPRALEAGWCSAASLALAAALQGVVIPRLP